MHGMISDAPTGEASITYVGGPTALLEWHGLRLLTDPTFDPGRRRLRAAGIQAARDRGPRDRSRGLRWPRPGAAMALDPTSSEFLTPRRLTGRQPK